MYEQVCSIDQAEGLRQLMSATPSRQVLVLVTSDMLERTQLYQQLVSEMSLRDTTCLSELDITTIGTLDQLTQSDREIVICLNSTAEAIKQAYLMLKTLANHSHCTQIGMYIVSNSSRQAKTIFKNLHQLAECSLSISISFVGHITLALHCTTQRKLTSSRMR